VAPERKLFQLCRFAAVAVLLLGAGTASAISFVPNPGRGLGPDDLSEIYCPCDRNPNPLFTERVMTVRESFDAFAGVIPHEWGIYFADDPSTLIPLLTASDTPTGGVNAAAAVDFEAGTVTDLETLTVEYSFTPNLGHFGFYLRVQNDDAVLLTYSQAALNGGADTFGSFPSLTSPYLRLVAFEVDGALLSIESVHGACAVPEPSVVWLVGGGLALLANRRRAA
jgi:hypothetical protein